MTIFLRRRTLGPACSQFSTTVLLAVVCAATPAILQAQGPDTPDAPQTRAVLELPMAPSATLGLFAETPAEQAANQATGTVQGLVTDTDGALVSDAHIILFAGNLERKATSDSDGRFTLTNVPAGAFRLTVSVPGLETGLTTGTAVAGEATQMPTILLRVATANSSVDVNLPQRELAQADIEEEEKQRAFGIFPNFLVSYNRTFTPLDAKQKFSLSWHVILDPTHFAISAIVAGIQTGTNTYPGYGQDFAGFSQRYGASLATTTTATLLRGTVFPVLFHQDPRYFYRGTGSKLSRAGYAIFSAVRSKGDNGKWQPAYASIGANFAAGAISNLYYDSSDRKGATLTVDNALISIGGVAVRDLFQEFLFDKITKRGKHLPPRPTTRPAAAATPAP